eukprot:4353117-Pyramimonas_sp.AAC.1
MTWRVSGGYDKCRGVSQVDHLPAHNAGPPYRTSPTNGRPACSQCKRICPPPTTAFSQSRSNKYIWALFLR